MFPTRDDDATGDPMEKLRTPDDRFDNLSDFPYEPRYVEVDDGDGGTLRVHYVDEGPRDGQVVLCLHGEPTWSYLYRKMIPVLVEAGHRVIAPDHPGFGRSDKPTAREDYTYARFVGWMRGVVEQLDLQGITLMCQDWGGLIGLRLVAEHPERFARVVTSNTFLPKGRPANEAFLQWRDASQSIKDISAGRIVASATVSDVSEQTIAAYDAPFPDESYKVGVRQFPMLVPAGPDDPAVPANLKAWEALERWEKPWLTAFGDSDPIMAGGDLYFQKKVPGTKGQPHTTIEDGGHFIQEDKGEELAQVIVRFMRQS
jgi:haloalkane dehalogenase